MRSEIFIPSEPVNLGFKVPVHDITFLVLEAPGDNNKRVTFTDPDPFLDLSLDPPHTGDPVNAPDPDMIGSHHEVGRSKHLPVPFLRKADPDRLYTGIAHLFNIKLFVVIRSLTFRY